jgi:glucose/arabinose dehydrogenase
MPPSPSIRPASGGACRAPRLVVRVAPLFAAALAACSDGGTGPADVTPPAITLTSPTHGTLGLTGAVTITADATDDVGVTLVQFAVDGVTLAQDATASFSHTLPATAAYASGAHEIRARARDAAGNWSDWARATVTFGGSVALPAGFTRTTYAQGFGALLTALTFAADGRLFATEISGAVRVVSNGTLLTQPFATLPAVTGGERGLIGVALSPGFGATGHLYVHYTTADGGTHNRVSRFAALGNVAGGAEQVLVDLPLLSAATNHNGGAIGFGPDGRLYVAVGENGNGTLAPSLNSPLGKILRFNADGTIPTDNPFLASTSGLNRAIWARGLRNPYTFAFHPTSGRLHINDVGQASWEEINLGRAGADYGWPATEGPTSNPAHDAPILAYARSASPTLFSGAAIVGGAFYDPPTPLFGGDYVGDYFFADYMAGWIYRLDPDNGNRAYAFANLGGNPTGLAVGPDGALYVLLGDRIDRIGR